MDSNREPLVSVLMPVYNCEAYIFDAVQSVLTQSFSDFELLIIDDSSTDRTLEIISGFNDSRIRLFRKTVNAGITDSLNFGIERASGRYIARMDGDDICEPHRFQTQVDFMEMHPEIGLLGSWYKILDTSELISVPQEHEDIKLTMVEYNPIAHPTVFIRRDILMTFNLRYDKKYEMAEDYDLWQRLLSFTKLYIIPDFLLQYRRYPAQSSMRSAGLQQSLSSMIRLRMLQKLVPEFSVDLREDQLKVYISNARLNFNEITVLIELIYKLAAINNQSREFKVIAFKHWLQSKQRLILECYFGYFRGVDLVRQKLQILKFYIGSKRFFLLSVRDVIKLMLN